MRRRRNRFDYVTILSPENWYESRQFEGKYPDLIQVYANHKSRLSYVFLHCGFTVPAINSSTTVFSNNGTNVIVGWENTYKKIWAKTLTIKCVASNQYQILYKSGTQDILITILSDLSTLWMNSQIQLSSHWLYVISKNISTNVVLNCYVLHCLTKSILNINLSGKSRDRPNYVLNITDNINGLTTTQVNSCYSIYNLKKVIIDTDKKFAIGCTSTQEFVIKNKKHYYLLNEGISIDSTENAPDFDVNNISSEKFYSGMGILMYDDTVIQMNKLKFNTATFKNLCVGGVYNCQFNHINLTQSVSAFGLRSTKIHTISIADDILNQYCFNQVNWDVLPTTSNSVKVLVEAAHNYLNGYSYDSNNILMLDLGIQNKLYNWINSFTCKNTCLFLKGGSLNDQMTNHYYGHIANQVYCDLVVVTDKEAFLHPFNMSNRNCFCIHRDAYEESGKGFRFIPYVNSNNEYIECFKQDESGVYSYIDPTQYDSVSLAYNEDGSMKALSKDDDIFKSCDLVYTGLPLDTTVCTTIPYAGIWIAQRDSGIYLIASTPNAPVLFDNSIKRSVSNVFRFQTVYKIKTAINQQWIDDRLPDSFVYSNKFITNGSLKNLDLSHNTINTLTSVFIGSVTDSLKIKTSNLLNAAGGARTLSITSNNTYILNTTITNNWYWQFNNRKNLYYLGTDTNSIEKVESYLPSFDSITRLDPENQSNVLSKRYYYINKYEDQYWFVDGTNKITYNEKTYELNTNGVTATHDFNFNALSKSSGDSIYLHFGKVSSLEFYKPQEDENTGEITQTKIQPSINNSIWNNRVYKSKIFSSAQAITTAVTTNNLYYIDLNTTDSNVKSRSMKYQWGLNNNNKLQSHPNLDGVNQLVINGPVYEIKILRNGIPTYWWLPVKNTDGTTVLKDIIHDV